MTTWLQQDFELEKRTLGEKAHRRLKELEQQVKSPHEAGRLLYCIIITVADHVGTTRPF